MKTYGAIVLFLNLRCPVGCASCNAAATPAGGPELAPEHLGEIFRRLTGDHPRGFPFPLRSRLITWTGGEPFVSAENLETGLKLAQDGGFQSEVLTSGIWFRSHPEWLDLLQPVGRVSLRISVDAEHQRRVPEDEILALAAAACQRGIPVGFTIREIPGEKHINAPFMERLKKEIPDFYALYAQRSRWINIIPHMPAPEPANRFRGSVQDVGKRRGSKWRSACRMGFKDLVIGPDGRIYPCCGLFSVSGYEFFAMGDLLETVTGRFDAAPGNSELLAILRDAGPAGVCRVLDEDPESLADDYTREPCQLCLALFRRLPPNQLVSRLSGCAPAPTADRLPNRDRR